MDFLDRLKLERDELAEKTEKLGRFLESGWANASHPISNNQAALLRTQLSSMYTYLGILRLRVADLNRMSK